MNGYSIAYRSITIIVIFYWGLISCHGDGKKDQSGETEWLIKNEKKMNSETLHVRDMINEDDKNVRDNTSITFVVTKHDTSILGAFVQKIEALNPCFYVSFTYSENSGKKKVITIKRDEDCSGSNTIPFSLIDSTRYFRVVFDTLK